MKNLLYLDSRLIKFAWLILLVAGFGGTAFGATFTVTKTADTNDNVCDADCSLREAIAAANAAASDDVINFDAGAFAAAQTITLTTGTELLITNNGRLTINGTGASQLTINGNNASRVFRILANASVMVDGVRITNGGSSSPDGSGISSIGNLTLTNSIISGNNKGGLYNGSGTLNIINVVIDSNINASGAGISNEAGILNVVNSTISNNSTGFGVGGGGIRNGIGTVTINYSIINNNNSTNSGGGVITFSGTLTINNSTISNNTVTQTGIGGGILNNTATINLNNTTIADNQAAVMSGGIRNVNGGTVNARNGIIANNADNGTAPDFHGTLNSQGYNLIENTTGATITGTTIGNITGQDPLLGALQENGGRTQTRALMVGSPAIDAADPNNVLPTDQRGASRPLDGDLNGTALPDIGAFEAGAKIVTKTADTNDGVCDADCSLREAIAEANGSAANDAIIFSSLFNSPQTITLTGGQLNISNNGSLAVAGQEANLLTLSGNNANRVFSVSQGAVVALNKMTIANGREDFNNGGGILVSLGSLTLNGVTLRNNSSSNGGAIVCEGGTLVLNDSTLTSNFGRLSGGGISHRGFGSTGSGSLTVNNSNISGNSSESSGGGIYSIFSQAAITNSTINNNSVTGGSGGAIYDSGTLTVTNSVISGNTATDSGGGIRHNFSGNTMTITDTTISNNRAGVGAGIRNDSGATTNIRNSLVGNNISSFRGGGILNDSATLTLTSSTVSGNSATDDGGGVFHAGGTLTLTNTTVSSNSATDQGGGIFNFSGVFNGRGSIVADNSAGGTHPDFSGNLISQGYNLIENTSGLTITGATTGNILGQDPQLAPLRNNGGATQTHALQPTSPAIDAADATNFPPVDQRGVPRPQDGDLNGSALPDIGAYERQATTFTVTKTADSNDGVCNADCSLREAIAATNAAMTPDNAIVLNAGVFGAARTITLTNGELQINNNGGTFVINGTGANLLTISANNQSRVFFINSGANVTLSGMRITGGSTTTNGGSIYNAGRLTVNNSTVTGNTAANFGGGIFNNDYATLNIINSIIGNNSANIGGGIFNFTNSNLTVTASTVSGNGAASGYGGGISNNAGTLTLNGSTISGNNGNGIYNGGIANLNNSTVSGNAAPNGGGIFSDVLLNISNSTVANNTASNQGGGVFRNAGTITARNSLFADNTAANSAPDFSGALASQGYNLIENVSGATITGTTTGNILGQNPQLLPLGNYGGLTQTHSLRSTSPAVDRGNSFGTTADQRGQTRPFDFPNIPNATGGNGADIGAFERQATDASGATLFDFDGDGKADVSVFRPDNGTWYLLQSQNGLSGIGFGQSGDRIVPADYDGDGKTDVAVFRSGIWYLQRSQTGFTGAAFGEASDVPVPADYDGDGKADLAVFRPGTGVWYLLRSALGFTAITFGQAGDTPVAADYDGDGKTDIAVYRSGIWYIQRSQLGFAGIAFGDGADKPVPADYDGDGKADVAVFRPNNGTWYLQQSTAGFTGVAFGATGDLPVPADYDGDGKADVAVFRSGTWYLQRSQAGFTGIAFGAATDKPVPNSFIP